MNSKNKPGLISGAIRLLGRELGFLIGGFLGILTGLALAPLVFLGSLIRGARVFHPEGVLCKAEIVALEGAEPGRSVGMRFAGPALVRFSGATKREGATGERVLGMAVRMRMPRDEDGTPVVGDQDLALGTFESFTSVLLGIIFGNDKVPVDPGDYLANEYDSVTPWRVTRLGVVRLRTLPGPTRDPNRANSRRARLEVDIAAGHGKLRLGYHPNDGQRGPVIPIAELRLLSVSLAPPQQLQVSLFRTGRNATAVGFRNAIRRITYPVSQKARRIRGG